MENQISVDSMENEEGRNTKTSTRVKVILDLVDVASKLSQDEIIIPRRNLSNVDVV